MRLRNETQEGLVPMWSDWSEGTGRVRKAQEGSGRLGPNVVRFVKRLRKAQKSSGRLRKAWIPVAKKTLPSESLRMAQDGSGRLRKDQEDSDNSGKLPLVSESLRKAQGGSGRLGRFKKARIPVTNYHWYPNRSGWIRMAQDGSGKISGRHGHQWQTTTDIQNGSGWLKTRKAQEGFTPM